MWTDYCVARHVSGISLLYNVICNWSDVHIYEASGMGVTQPISSFPLFSPCFNACITETLITHSISHLHLTHVKVAITALAVTIWLSNPPTRGFIDMQGVSGAWGQVPGCFPCNLFYSYIFSLLSPVFLLQYVALFKGQCHFKPKKSCCLQ